MGERKVQNKYYPPDFDPSKIPKGVRKRSHKVRMMMPMSVQCNACGEYIYNGKKFNALIEPVSNEDYLGIAIYRLAIRCPNCSNNITIKTDPANCDYICETGATRNFEPWRAHNLEEAEREALRDEARKDVMWNLEAKTYDAQKEMDSLEQLDELKSMRARQSQLSTEEILSRNKTATVVEKKPTEDKMTEEEEEEYKAALKEREDNAAKKKKEALLGGPNLVAAAKPAAKRTNDLLGGSIVVKKPAKKKKKPKTDASTTTSTSSTTTTPTSTPVLCAYGSD
eukprot:TRINITY_DN12445_c0_g1_i1.p1 TRINITY_DN12445_c0_g1~~TRINITY_DN12445_c0_g1_i1.p1  ORF type:complete len:282 (-),score=45.80 TRINITY_DN12445_c0_g1_i1:172-1017(-)